MQSLLINDDTETLKRIQKLKNNKQQLDTRIEKLQDLLVDGTIDSEAYSKTYSRYTTQKEDIVSELEGLKMSNTTFKKQFDVAFDALDNFKQTIQILNVTRQELVDIIKEGVKLELNRQRSIGNPLNRLSITGEDTEYLTRNEVSKVLNVTVQTLNNWRREGVLNPLKIGGRVLYRKEDVYNNSRLVA